MPRTIPEISSTMALLQSIVSNLQVHHFILTGVVTLLFWLILSFRNSEVWKLRRFPTVGPSLPVVGTIKSMKSSHNVAATGIRKWPGRIFKVPTQTGWQVVITDPKRIDDIRKAPEHILSISKVVDETLQTQYTLNHNVTQNKFHHSIIRTRLRKETPGLVPGVYEEVVESCNEYIPVENEWAGVVPLENMRTIVARAANRIFVGPILCKNPDWIKHCIEFTIDVTKTAFILRLFPSFLRPLVNYFVSGKVARRNREGLELLRPLIATRRDGVNATENYDDFLAWLIDESQGEDREDWPIAARIFNLNFAAIHTSSLALTHALLDLAANPEYLKPLRDEVDEVTKREGWTGSALEQMHRIDSFIKESQRLHPVGILLMGRRAIVDYTFSDGTTLPAGTVLGVSSYSVNRDPRIYEDPHTFDGFRFVKMKERAPDKIFDMVTTNSDFLVFGQGRHACPGRFFASTEIKIIFAHIVTTYDVKLVENARPPDMFFMNSILPNLDSKIYFRKRQ